MKIWNRLSLLQRFSLTGGAVMVVAVGVIGTWVTARIEQGVVNNSATSAALYMESFIAPLSQELARVDRLSAEASRALDEVFEGTALGERMVSYRIWKRGGLIAYASDPELVGARFEPSHDLTRAWAGEVSATFEDPDDPSDDAESAAERATGVPLLEIYSPVREVWTGEVIAVAEFYEIATDLKIELAQARRNSWLLVASTLLASALALFGIVRAGSLTIARQEAQLRTRIAQSEDLAEQNLLLRQRAIGASARAAAQAERRLRQVSADLHDGPGQNLGLAALRLERIIADDEAAQAEAAIVREALGQAVSEIRAISRGLSLPELENMEIGEVAARAVEGMARQLSREVPLSVDLPDEIEVDQSAKIATYRFLQEALSNAGRHAPGAAIDVALGAGGSGKSLRVAVADDGPGFDPESATSLRADGGLGLAGMRDRIESLGGQLEVESKPGTGTRLSMILPALGGP